MPERRLMAVFAADVVGYTRLMHENEAGTHARLMALRGEVIDFQVRVMGGRVVKSTGDGILAEFPSALEAVLCAMEVQRNLLARNMDVPKNQQIIFRIGLNLDEVIVEINDIYGDGVNIAVRLEGLSPPGGICVSRSVRDQITHTLPIPFTDLGRQTVKNFARPIQAFCLTSSDIARLAEAPRYQTIRDQRLHAANIGLNPRDHRLSVAVMPFENLSNLPAQQYFVDGMVEDIITALSKFRSLFVIARDSTSAYRNHRTDPRRVASELDVRYLVEGGVQNVDGHLRISARLIDTASAGHMWAENFDGDVSEIFLLQDRVTERIATTIEPKIVAREIERANRKPTDNLDAYDYFLRALPLRLALNYSAGRKALTLLMKAIDLDPMFAPALAHASACYLAKHDQGWATLGPDERDEALRLATAAIEADMDDSVALCLGGHTIAGLTGEYDSGLSWIDRALKLNRNYAEAWMRSSMVRVYANDLVQAIAHAERAIELSPLDTKLYHPLSAQAYAHLFLGDYNGAAMAARRALLGRQKPEMAYRILVTALTHTGRIEEAKAAAADLLNHNPKFTISAWRARSKFTRDKRLDLMYFCLREIGLPE
jgi:adenylate cyclase